MAHFHLVPSGRRLSGQTLPVNGDSVTIGLYGSKDAEGNDLLVTNETDHLTILPAGSSGDSVLYTIRVKNAARATRAVVSDTIYALTQRWETWDKFKIEFQFKTVPAGELIVRDVTKDVYGVDTLAYGLPTISLVNMATFVAGDPANAFSFLGASGHPVSLRLYAAKMGSVERAYWLMLPLNRKAASLMIVISHGFGQKDRYYSDLGYGNPFSKRFLDDVRDRFVLGRWGMQVGYARSDMGLLMPVRARGGTGGGSELGPFVSQAGLGTGIVNRVAALAGADTLLQSVGVVTFSSGIYDANTFISTGGKGLPFRLMVNQDPSHGVHISGSGARKEYLSGYTTGGPRAGFEYMPKARWVNDPRRAEMEARLGREYLHTWALPTYTLALALRS